MNDFYNKDNYSLADIEYLIRNEVEEDVHLDYKEGRALAKIAGVGSVTIKRHIAKLKHIKYFGSGYSGHWEIIDNNESKKNLEFSMKIHFFEKKLLLR